ncbi:putative isoleucyl-trna synthetase protein [Eutypa lata UCREL1]|uniref:isoleucine--tRNA ligase n=1 Tax=Eutypa lata (strain UCR-EL1) TaxID=1287681 RepID=M7TX40_EUTLA|nr:putative isoleucyl-trna synthetase protein [Eutypa lata UCREL1]
MSINFPKVEEEVLAFWKEVDAFQTQLRLTESGKRYNFYDGPPFATGLPHYGHLLASTIKDIIPRYWSMKGYHVVRRFGWDTHGLPIEYEIDKKLGISGRDAVMEMGVEWYNEECRAIVMTYAQEWRSTIERLGRWIDFDNDYKTMDVNFMESCWWVFKQLFDKGSVYRAYQIMPYSTALCTPLSQMEAKQNEKTTQDPAIVVSFPVVGVEGQENTSLLIYTTTPWTLPSNLLIAVHPDFEYVKILDETSQRYFILLEAGIGNVFKSPQKGKYKIVQKIMGRDMIGWKYEPIFKYFVEKYSDCFQVTGADYVEAGEGTGLVHQAPAFGQEDYDAAVAAGFINPQRLPPCPVDDKGCFTAEVPDYAGQHVKTADKAILKDLRQADRLLLESQTNHVDKFCWRSDTQLIRKAVSSWFIRVKDHVPAMLENLEKTNWVPQFAKEKRFATWVANAHDWNISRNRYWGTPIPLWVSEDYEEVVCVGSIAELKELSGHTGDLTDIHRDKVDLITIPSRQGKGVLHRIDEIFDCWFESGSMPLFPADFIAEGLDQTRGWFYTLSVLGNHLFQTSPFKNCIVNGIVLAEDDALRLYLINSPVVRAEPIRFKEADVRDIVSRVLLPLWNSYRFFSEQAAMYTKTTGQKFTSSLDAEKVSNIMDRWILADCQSLLQYMDQEMLVIDNLTNWYIRFNRKRLKGLASLGPDDTIAALNTLLEVLFTLVRALAPFTPFITEHIYKLLKEHLGDLSKFEDSRSVHFLPFPTAQEALIDEEVERKLSAMQKVIQLGRTARDQCNVTMKTPLRTLVVMSDPHTVSDVESLKTYILEELNVTEVVLTSDEQQFNIQLEAKVDWPVLGKKLKKDVKVVRDGLPKLSQEDLQTYSLEKKITVGGIELGEGDLSIVRVLGKDGSTEKEKKWEPAFADDIIVLLDATIYPELTEEGLARDLISRVQRLRKKAGLAPTDDILVQCSVLANPAEIDVAALVASRQSLFDQALRGSLELVRGTASVDGLVLEEEQVLGSLTLMLRLLRL